MNLHLPLHLSHAADASDGGISTAVAALVLAQQRSGLDPIWFTSYRFSPHQRDRAVSKCVAANDPALAHLHGLWRSPTRIAPRLAAAGLPLVIAPHGMLDPGALSISSRRRKQLVWRLWERRALQSARCLHALCLSEARAIRALLPNTPIALIPNGVELPGASAADLLAPWAKKIPPGESVLLFLGRFHSKKSLEPLLAAWQMSAAVAERAGWWFAVVGYGDNGAPAQQVARAQAQERGELQRVRLFELVFGAKTAAALSAATAFVLTSLSEGLTMAALEAMACQRPCLLSAACNLPEAFRVGAALPAEPNPAALVAALERCFKLSAAECTAMGHAGPARVRERFSLPQVASQIRELYSWVLGGGEPPASVVLG